jgi:ankyrin repeat protein
MFWRRTRGGAADLARSHDHLKVGDMLAPTSENHRFAVGRKAMVCLLVILVSGLTMIFLQFWLADGPAAADDLLIEGANLQKEDWIKRALERGANVNARDSTGATALIWASRDGDVELVRSLLARGADTTAGTEVGMTPLMFAANGDHLEVAEILLRAGAPINQRLPVAGTVLHVASGRCKPEMVQLFIDHGADLDARDNRGRTPLMRCVSAIGNPPATAAALIAAGARLDAIDDRGETAFEMAQSEGLTELATLLAQAGARSK